MKKQIKRVVIVPNLVFGELEIHISDRFVDSMFYVKFYKEVPESLLKEGQFYLKPRLQRLYKDLADIPFLEQITFRRHSIQLQISLACNIDYNDLVRVILVAVLDHGFKEPHRPQEPLDLFLQEEGALFSVGLNSVFIQQDKSETVHEEITDEPAEVDQGLALVENTNSFLQNPLRYFSDKFRRNS